MIDFACKEFSINEVVKCSLGLTKSEYSLLQFLLSNENKTFTTNELAKRNKLDLTTVQKAVKKFDELGVVAKGQLNLKSGGYIFTYEICSKKKVTNKILEIINEWHEKVIKELKKI